MTEVRKTTEQQTVRPWKHGRNIDSTHNGIGDYVTWSMFTSHVRVVAPIARVEREMADNHWGLSRDRSSAIGGPRTLKLQLYGLANHWCNWEIPSTKALRRTALGRAAPVYHWNRSLHAEDNNCAVFHYCKTFKALELVLKQEENQWSGRVRAWDSSQRIHYSGHTQFIGRKWCFTASISLDVIVIISCNNLLLLWWFCVFRPALSSSYRLITLDLQQRMKVHCTHTQTVAASNKLLESII